MGAYATNLEVPVGSHHADHAVYSKEKNVLFCLRHWTCRFCFLTAQAFCCIELPLSWTRQFFFFFLLLQVSVQPQKTSPTRSRTCGQSAARTLEGRTLSPVQMGRSQATVGECHIPARPAKPSVHCLIWSKQHQPQLSIPVTFTAATKLNHCFTSRQSSHIKLCVGLNIPCYSVWGITFGSYYLFNLTI